MFMYQGHWVKVKVTVVKKPKMQPVHLWLKVNLVNLLHYMCDYCPVLRRVVSYSFTHSLL